MKKPSYCGTKALCLWIIFHYLSPFVLALQYCFTSACVGWRIGTHSMSPRAICHQSAGGDPVWVTGKRTKMQRSFETIRWWGYLWFLKTKHPFVTYLNRLNMWRFSKAAFEILSEPIYDIHLKLPFEEFRKMFTIQTSHTCDFSNQLFSKDLKPTPPRFAPSRLFRLRRTRPRSRSGVASSLGAQTPRASESSPRRRNRPRFKKQRRRGPG